ncbi:linoleate diol synthase [Gigaspora margarita]|uniref:Linoleate diol synthase n=1 Tax=Gigaspora margarita TaxID=4874 RepID=A0A8H3X241_GIGMA|nr:linoleate diol synthase [Gigaspora margarita]
MSKRSLKFEKAILSAPGDIKNEISKHFESLHMVEKEINVFHELVHTVLHQDPIDDSKYMMEDLIQIMSKRFSKDPELVNFLERLLVTQLWNDITKPPSMLAGYSYRSSDGSDYSRLRLYSHLGKAGSQYARSVPIQKPFSKLPDAGQIFDGVMKRDKFIPHSSGISATMFYLAIIITHDLFNSDPLNHSINRNSSYADLSPLYGNSNEEQAKVRTGVLGHLKPDTFADSRMLLQPPGVGSLLILFSRNHNYIADYLYKTGIFKDDEHLFQTARLINCGYYLKIILRDYLSAILGLDRTPSNWFLDPTKPYGSSLLSGPLPTGTGNQISIEFNYIYRWHPTISEADAEWIDNEFKRILKTDNLENVDPNTFVKKMSKWNRSLPKEPSKWTFNNMKRDKNGKFSDRDIAKELIEGTEKIAGAFGANNIPSALRIIEIAGIQTARELGVCSLNDLRKFLNLVPYASFEDMTADKELATKLKTLYGDINNVELYPGLMTEKTKPGDKLGSAIALPFTASRAILSDAVNLVRNDRFATDDLNQHNIGYWDWKNLELPDKQFESRSIIHQLILKHLPGRYPNNSVYALYPFLLPTKTKEILKQRGDELWKFIDFNRPRI